MPCDSAKLAAWFDVFPNRSSVYLLVLVYRLRPAPCRLIRRNAQQDWGREDSCSLQRGQCDDARSKATPSQVQQ